MLWLLISALITLGLPVASARDVGMSAERLAAIDRVVMRGVARRGFPGAAVVVGRYGHVVVSRGYGTLDWSDDSRCVDADESVYDLASLTKVVATTSAIMILVDRHQLSLDDRVVKYLPAFAKSGGIKATVTIRHLLTHRSGLPSGRDLWRAGRTAADARRMVLATSLQREPGGNEIYSDLGADVLAMVAERVTGEPMDVFLQRELFGKLGMKSTGFRPVHNNRVAAERIAPTEGRARGTVHDGNALALGGVAGHAGLFSSASDLAVFAQMMLGGGEYNGVRIVSEPTVSLFIRRTAGWRALGWETCYGGGSCGQFMSERGYGHTGFTGTSMWIDPDRQSFTILLTNWVRPRPEGRTPDYLTLNDVRADVADIAALSVIDDSLGMKLMPSTMRADRATSWENAGERLLNRCAR
ncbi:MAG: beta-lactamase family protein [Gemmatimonadota bacterium]|nr:beta-lactamase family protein [Gemmatimonadota bacterium]